MSIFNKISEMAAAKKIEPLDDEADIEVLLMEVRKLDKRIEWNDRLKKSRVAAISAESDRLEAQKQMYKEIIQATLKAKNSKSLNFPGVGRANRKDAVAKWVVNDEDALLAELKTKLSPSAYEDVVREVPKIVKKELDKMLNMWDKSGELPSSVAKEIGEESLAITFDKDIDSIGDDSEPTSLATKVDQASLDSI